MENTMRFVKTVAAGLALAALALGAQAQTPGVSASTILIGQSTPLTGANAELGNDIRNGALAYFAKVNEAGGVHGRKIELVTLDDGNNGAARARPTPRSWSKSASVFALFGYPSATLSRPALPTVEKHRVPFLSPFTGADPMRVFHKHVYNMRGSYAEELEKIVDHFEPLGLKRFSIVHYDDVVGKENLTAVERALKKRNLAVVSVAAWKDRAKPDIEGGVKEVMKGQPDVVILTTLYKATADFVRAAKKAGFRAQMASNSFPGASPLAKELGSEGAGLIVATVVPPPTKRSQADRAGIPGGDREAAGQEGVLLHLARVVHRRQGDGGGDAPRRAEADARSVPAGARRHEGLRHRRLHRELLAHRPQRQLVRRAHRARPR